MLSGGGLPGPRPVAVKLPSAWKVMVTGSVRLAESCTAYSASMLRPPLLVAAGVICTGLAAARCVGEPMATCMLRAASAKGLTRKRSPTLALPASSSKRKPSSSTGRPAMAVRVSSDRRTMLMPDASKRTS